MFRNLIVVQLIAALLASQWLCCCTALASPAKPSTITPASHSSPLQRGGHSCCSHRKAAHDDSTKNTSPSHGQHSPGEKKDCPCKDKGKKADLTASSSDGGQAVSGLRLTLADINVFCSWQLAADCVHLSGVSARDPADSVTASLTADDLLFAHHNLRC